MTLRSNVYSASAFRLASWLTDPVCWAHQWYHEIWVVDHMFPGASKVERVFRKGLRLTCAGVSGATALMTTLPGMALRYATCSLQTRPFIYYAGEGSEKELQEELSLLSWNLCCVPAGYSITDGNVTPWTYRIERLLEEVNGKDADVVCLYEIFDIQTALRFYHGLKEKYRHFFFHMGPNTLGPPSGMFVASKVKVSKPEFTPFSQEQLNGRAKYSGKGVFSVLLDNNVALFSTHLQHSEIPDKPTEGEQTARKLEMELIVEKIKAIPDRVVVLTGDLNLDLQEYHDSKWKKEFSRGEIDEEGWTWGGDQFCATLMGKKVSKASVIDFTLVLQQDQNRLKTECVAIEFDPTKFSSKALTDHKGLLSTISL